MSKSKLNAAMQAIDWIKPKIDSDSIVGVGTGSTVNYFIDELGKIKNLFNNIPGFGHGGHGNVCGNIRSY
mgnify:CR=1 FL=1